MKLLGTHGKKFWTFTSAGVLLLLGRGVTLYIFTNKRVCTNTMYGSGLVDLLITNANILASLSGARRGFMPPVLEANKQSFEYCNSKIISTSLTARNGNAHLLTKQTPLNNSSSISSKTHAKINLWLDEFFVFGKVCVPPSAIYDDMTRLPCSNGSSAVLVALGRFFKLYFSKMMNTWIFSLSNFMHLVIYTANA